MPLCRCEETVNKQFVQVVFLGPARQELLHRFRIASLLVPSVVMVFSIASVLGRLIMEQVVVWVLRVTLGALVVLLKDISDPRCIVPPKSLGWEFYLILQS